MKSILLLSCLSFGSIHYAQKLVSHKIFPCQAIGESIYKERIASQRLVADTLYLEVDLMLNCSVRPEIKLRTNGDSLLIDLENTSEIYAACDCYYPMQFIISDSYKDRNYLLFINRKAITFSHSRFIDLPPLKITEASLKNETDASGDKIGYWLFQAKSGNRYIEFYDKKSSGETFPVWTVCYSPKNEILSVEVSCYDGKHSLTADEYYRLIQKIEEEENLLAPR